MSESLNANGRPVLCLVQGREKLLASFFEQLKRPAIVEPDWRPAVISRHAPALVLSIGEAAHEIWICFQEARKRGIPSLTVQDGIPEWRDIWENPRYGQGGNHLNRQGMCADKIACHGRLQVRLFESWGMVGQPEAVGIPWFDRYLEKKSPRTPREGKKRLLVMTANTPGFTPIQVEAAEKSLLDVKQYLQKQFDLGTDLARAGGLNQKLNLRDRFELLAGGSLARHSGRPTPS